ncbi:alpha/beta fold hydrolase [Amycolatopsis japonica]|uniref:alpha/beta fold hydrolase n=1 Tax=Amycolatopsis japonica TaxID=208439 RepID=UPI00366F780C
MIKQQVYAATTSPVGQRTESAGRRRALRGTGTIPMDLRGHGDSSVPLDAPYGIADFAADVVAVIEDAGNGPFGLLGTSLGGMVVLHVAAERPDLSCGTGPGRHHVRVSGRNGRQRARRGDRAPRCSRGYGAVRGGNTFAAHWRIRPDARSWSPCSTA